MKINIRGEKVKITKAMGTHIELKLSKLEKYLENPENITFNAIVKVGGLQRRIEITALTKKFTLRAEESHSDFYAAVDLVVDKLERQIIKNKDKLKDKYKNVGSTGLVLDFEEEPKLSYADDVRIVKRKNMEMKPMDEEEALLQAELLNHDFFVFKNIEESCISVIYKRKDGCYGIINTK